MTKQALETAVTNSGGQKRLAERIGTTQSVVWYWLNEAKRPVPPAEFVERIERETGVPRHELRPDLFQKRNRGGSRGVS